MHEHGSNSGRRLSFSSNSASSGSPRTSGTKLDSESGAGRAAARRQAGRASAGRTSGRASPMASSSHHSQHTAAAAAAASQSAVDAIAVAVADKLNPRATASAAAAVTYDSSNCVADCPSQLSVSPTDTTVVGAPSGRLPQRISFPDCEACCAAWVPVTESELLFAELKHAVTPVGQFVKTLFNKAHDPVAVGDGLLWLLLLPLVVLRHMARSPGVMALLRVTLETTAELLVAAMLAGAAICVTALHVLAEHDAGAGAGGDKRPDPVRCRPYLLQPEPPLPVDAAGERCSPRPVLSSPLSLH